MSLEGRFTIFHYTMLTGSEVLWPIRAQAWGFCGQLFLERSGFRVPGFGHELKAHGLGFGFFL